MHIDSIVAMRARTAGCSGTAFRASAAALATALAVTACGVDPGTTTTEDGDAAVRAAGSLSLTPVPLPTPTPIQSPRIVSSPPNLTVGLGAGAQFSVYATGFSPFTYQWFKDNVAMPAQRSATLAFASTVATDAATYTIRVTDRFGSQVSASATLGIVSNGWARLGGTSFAGTPVVQQPSIALCAQPSVAHILPSTNRNALYVKYFDGMRWRDYGTGGILNATSGGSAAEPSLACVNDGTTERPVVAWSEGSGSTREIFVKVFDGSSWQPVGTGALNTAAGSNATRPVLRTTPLDASTGNTFVGGLTRRSAVAWIENGVPSARTWDGAWNAYAAGGQVPGVTGATDIALTIELDDVGRTYPPVLAWLAPHNGNLRQFAATHNAGLATWVQMGAPITSTVSLGGTNPSGRIGIGVGKYLQGRTPVAVWADSATPSVFRSYMYPSEHFVNGVANQNWQRYGTAFSMSGALKAAALDPREFRREGANACALGNLPTFGLAISHAGGFEVRRGTCGVGLSPADWAIVRTAHTVPLEEIALRLGGADDPYVAGTQIVNGNYQLSVWKFYP